MAIPQWLGPKQPYRSTTFMTIKYILFSFIAFSICLNTILLFFVSPSTEEMAKIVDPPTITELESNKNGLYVIIVITLLIDLAGSYGVIGENFCVVATFALGLMICTLLSLTKGNKVFVDVMNLLVNCIVTFLLSAYAFLIRQDTQMAPPEEYA